MEGQILRRTFSGFGPFRREHWDAEPFVWKLAKNGDGEHVEDIDIERVDAGNKILVNGEVRGVLVCFADFEPTKPCQPVNFNFLSVAGIQVNGKATLVGSISNSTREDDIYAA